MEIIQYIEAYEWNSYINKDMCLVSMCARFRIEQIDKYGKQVTQ